MTSFFTVYLSTNAAAGSGGPGISWSAAGAQGVVVVAFDHAMPCHGMSATPAGHADDESPEHQRPQPQAAFSGIGIGISPSRPSCVQRRYDAVPVPSCVQKLLPTSEPFRPFQFRSAPHETRARLTCSAATSRLFFFLLFHYLLSF